MASFTVFDQSAMNVLGLNSWLDVPEIAKAEQSLQITRRGHLIDWFKYQTQVHSALQKLCLEVFDGKQFWGPLPLRLWYSNHELAGNLVALERFDRITRVVHPNVLGDIANQATEYATTTVYAPENVTDNLLNKWLAIVQYLPGNRRSAVFRSRTRFAVQLHAYMDEFTFGDHIDVTVEAIRGIKNVKNCGVILGQSCTFVSGVPMKKTRKDVEQLYGPFVPI